ncbi:hypothetical protein [Ideonella sp.]|uniref:hypothetical protein n=1 Tax=Ideonella sp. TaxID=1929293 RepID=UPI0035B380FA
MYKTEPCNVVEAGFSVEGNVVITGSAKSRDCKNRFLLEQALDSTTSVDQRATPRRQEGFNLPWAVNPKEGRLQDQPAAHSLASSLFQPTAGCSQ